MEIAGRKVGINYSPLVIAEIGINHNGSLETAFEMVDAAKRAGAELIKHQTHIVEDEMSSKAKEIKPGNADESIYEIMKRCALSEQEEMALQEYVNEKNMIFISSPFSRAAVNRLVKMDVPAFKIGSGECNNYPLLRHIASFGKPVIISTGMNSIDSVAKAVTIFEDREIPYSLLHTTNLYPTPPHLVRLGGMTHLHEAFPDVPFGLSDHTTSNHASFAAVALGASIVERHFTDHMNREGPDIVCSMDEQACKELISGVNLIKQMRGGDKKPAEEEKVTSNFAFATVVSIKNIDEGETLNESNIWVKRPGIGDIKAEDFNEVIGKVANRDIESGEHLSWSDFS